MARVPVCSRIHGFSGGEGRLGWVLAKMGKERVFLVGFSQEWDIGLFLRILPAPITPTATYTLTGCARWDFPSFFWNGKENLNDFGVKLRTRVAQEFVSRL